MVAEPAPPTVVMLGPQHPTSDAGRVLADLGVRGLVALITAGWQEREIDDDAVIASLGTEAINLTLHARSEEVFARDPELAEAYKQRQIRLRQLQDVYRIRLDHAAETARAIALRQLDPALLAEERQVSLDIVRRLDDDHLERCRALHAAFEDRWRPGQRASVGDHRRELAALLESSAALVIAGGHVAVLLNRMKLFDIGRIAGGRPIVAWSAGAMVLTERVVLFHDDPPHGEPVAELLDAGLALVPGIVALPDARRRLAMQDPDRLTALSRRFAPATCVTLDPGQSHRQPAPPRWVISR